MSSFFFTVFCLYIGRTSSLALDFLFRVSHSLNIAFCAISFLTRLKTSALIERSFGSILSRISRTIFSASFSSTRSFVWRSRSILKRGFLIDIFLCLSRRSIALSLELTIPTKNIFSSTSFEIFLILSGSLKSANLTSSLSESSEPVFAFSISAFFLSARSGIFCISFTLSKRLSILAKALSCIDASIS